MSGTEAPAAETRRPRRRDKYEGADEVMPYPGTVLRIFNVVAWIGLLLGIVGGFLLLTAGQDANSSSQFVTSDTDSSVQVVMGIGLVVAAAVQWAFFRAIALVVEYLWEIQARV